MAIKRISPFFILSLTIGLGLSSTGAMDDREQRGVKRPYHQDHCQRLDTTQLDRAVVRRRLSSDVTRISTPHNHLKFLQDGISSAAKSILITSYGVDREVFETGNLYQLLEEAARRNVRIYIYNIDSKDIGQKLFHFFKRNDIAYDVTYTHAKIFTVDESKVAIGSYNWLSKDNNWQNATLCLSGRECSELVPLIWEDLKYYRNLQFCNFRQVADYEDNPENDGMDIWDLDSKTSLHYIHSLESHGDFIDGIFERAREKVVLCSPFINQDSGYQRDFTKELLKEVLRKKVHLYFVCRTEDTGLSHFKNYLGTLLNSPFMHIIPMSNIHLKTVIVDDNMIAEGSFNWLSASRDDLSDHHNHEVTLVLEGDGSKTPIQDFYDSPVGQEILKLSVRPAMPLERESQSLPKKTPESTLNHPVSSVLENTPWKISPKGNPYISIAKGILDQKEHYAVVIRGHNDSYSAIVDQVPLKSRYASEEEAKLAALDTLRLTGGKQN